MRGHKDAASLVTEESYGNGKNQRILVGAA